MKKIIFALTTLLIGQFTFMHSKKTESLKALDQKSLNEFYHKFVAWKKTLSAEQINLFHELFEQYEQTYQEKRNAKNIDLLQTFEKSLQHLMDNWQSFYKEYSNALIFHQKVQNWQDTLAANKQARLAPLLQTYESAFQEYDKNPANAINKKAIQELMTKIQTHITT